MVIIPDLTTLILHLLTLWIGYNQGVFSGVLTMPAFQNHMGDYDSSKPQDQSRKGWLTSILELGAWVGTLLSGFMAETASRKYAILIATAVFILGVVIQTTAITYVSVSCTHNSY
jgi:MFS family permease